MSAYDRIALLIALALVAGYVKHRFIVLREENYRLRIRLARALGHPANRGPKLVLDERAETVRWER